MAEQKLAASNDSEKQRTSINVAPPDKTLARAILEAKPEDLRINLSAQTPATLLSKK